RAHRRLRQLPGHRARLPGFARQPAHPDPRRADRRLSRAGHALRKRGAPDHDPLHAALGGRGRDPRPAALRLGTQHHLAHRRDPADRHRQEERHHDDRLRGRRAARARPGAREGHLRGLHDPLPADHDDHHGGPARGGAARDRLRRGRRAAPAAGHRHRRRPAHEPAPDPVFHAGDLYLPGSFRRLAVKVQDPETETRMRKFLVLLLLPGCALLYGCAVGPDYKRPELEVPAAYKGASAADWKPAEPRDAVPRGMWWKMFSDPELDALMARVDAANQSIAAAEAQVRISAALAEQSRAGFWPQLTGTIQKTESK